MLFSSMEKKKTSKTRIVIIVSVAIFLVILLFPVKYYLKDGGSAGYHSLFGVYDVRECHEIYSGAADYTPVSGRFTVGTRITLFGKVVYDDTHPDPPLEEDEL